MSILDIDERAHVPGHYGVLTCSLVLSTATLAVQLMHTPGDPATTQGVITLRVACTIVWAWYFTAYAAHKIARRIDAAGERTASRLKEIEKRLQALEASEPAEGRSAGLDPETIESARVIAHRLMRGGR